MDIMDYEMLGVRIREARKSRGYTQSELAELTEYSVQHISHVETGNTKLSVELLICIANALDVSLDELLIDSLDLSPKAQHSISIDVRTAKERDAIVRIVKMLEDEIVNLRN